MTTGQRSILQKLRHRKVSDAYCSKAVQLDINDTCMQIQARKSTDCFMPTPDQHIIHSVGIPAYCIVSYSLKQNNWDNGLQHPVFWLSNSYWKIIDLVCYKELHCHIRFSALRGRAYNHIVHFHYCALWTVSFSHWSFMHSQWSHLLLHMHLLIFLPNFLWRTFFSLKSYFQVRDIIN